MRKIISMHVENFLSYQEADFDFDDVGFVLVEGKNGAGKSGMICALRWCLFGETVRGYKYDEVVNRKVGKDCLVMVVIRDDNGEEFGVCRTRRHTRFKNSLTLSTQGADVSPAGEKETQAEVERILGCTDKTFMSSVVFGQNRAYRFSELTDAEQKKILDEVLGVERFADACKAARKSVDGIQAELDANRRALARAEEARDEVEAEAVDLRVKDVDFAANQKKKIEVEQEKLRKVKQELDKTRKQHDVPKLKELFDAAQQAVKVYERKLTKAVEADAAASSSLALLKQKVATQETLLKESDRLGGDCPTCGQKPTKRLVALIAETREKLKGLTAEMAESSRQADVAATALGIAKTKLKEARAELEQARGALDRSVSAATEVAGLRRRAQDHQERIAEIGREVNPYKELAAKAESKHTQLAADVDQLENYIKNQQEPELRRAQFWVKAFGNAGLRSLLVDSSLPLLNQEAARVSRALTGGAISVEFSATSEQKSGKVVDRFEVKVDNRHGAGDYQGNSAGERAKVDLCVGLALQKLVASRSSASFNLAIFDEVLDHLDETAHERVLEVLSELDRESVLVVSHDEDLKAWFPAVWSLEKRNGFSHIQR